MGTPSLTTFVLKEKKNNKVKTTKVSSVYKEYDGYPEGYGVELAKFISSKEDPDIYTIAEELLLSFENKESISIQSVQSEILKRKFTYEIIIQKFLQKGEEDYIIMRCQDNEKNRWIFRGNPKKFVKKYQKLMEH